LVKLVGAVGAASVLVSAAPSAHALAASAPLAPMDYGGSCPYVSSSNNGGAVTMRSGTFVASSCPWTENALTSTTFTLKDQYGLCLDAPRAMAGASLVEATCSGASTQTWQSIPGVLPHAVRYVQVVSWLCVTPQTSNAVLLEPCAMESDFVPNGPVTQNVSGKCLSPLPNSSAVGLSTNCTSPTNTWGYMLGSGTTTRLRSNPANPEGWLCLSPGDAHPWVGQVIVQALCGQADTWWTIWTIIPGTVAGTEEYEMNGLCVASVTGETFLFLEACGRAADDFR
jgi:hypothetical protein